VIKVLISTVAFQTTGKRLHCSGWDALLSSAGCTTECTPVGLRISIRIQDVPRKETKFRQAVHRMYLGMETKFRQAVHRMYLVRRRSSDKLYTQDVPRKETKFRQAVHRMYLGRRRSSDKLYTGCTSEGDEVPMTSFSLAVSSWMRLLYASSLSESLSES
jgi:hypothetical protein